jgi:hypothetical protein
MDIACQPKFLPHCKKKIGQKELNYLPQATNLPEENHSKKAEKS